MTDRNIPIVTTDPLGNPEVRSIPESILREADYGQQVATGPDIDAHLQGIRDREEQAAFDEKYALTSHPLEAAGAYFGGGNAAWLRGVTHGISDEVFSKIGDAIGLDVRGKLRDWQRVHPIISELENLTGSTAGALGAGAGAGAVARGALGAAGVARAGGLAASIGLGEGTVARGVLGATARGAVEGGLYSGGQELSREALSRDPDLHAERILSEVGHGALFGGPAALGLHGLSSLASKGLTSLEGSLARRAAEEAAADTSGGVRVAGEDGIESLRDLARRGAGKAELVEHAEALDKELSERYLTKLRAVDETGAAGPSLKEFLARADEIGAEERAAAEPVAEKFGAATSKGSDLDTLTKWTKALHRQFVDTSPEVLASGEARYKDISFAKWEEAAQKLSSAIRDNTGTATKLRDLMYETSDSALGVSGAPRAALDEAASARDLYRSIGDAKQLLKLGTEEEIAAKLGQTERPGLTEGLVDAAKKKIRNYATDVAVHTALAPFGPVGTMVAPFAKQLVRKVAESASLEGISSGVRQAIVESAGALARGGKIALAHGGPVEPLGIALTSDVRKNAEKVRERAYELAAAPDRQLHYATQAAASLRAPAPIASAMGASVSRVVNELVARAPKDRNQAGLFKVPAGMSDTEASRYVAVAKAVAAPRSIIAEARHGALTKEQVDAVRSAWPHLYQEMYEELKKAIIGHDKSPSYQDRIAISILLGEDADPTMSPAFIAATQPQKGGGGSGQPAGPKSVRSNKPIKLASLALSQSGADSAVARAQTGGKSK